MVESVDASNLPEVNAFLSRHEDSAQFLINNLREHGASLSDHPNSGNFKTVRVGGSIVAVFCLVRRGNLIIQSDIDEPGLFLDACAAEPIPLKGFVGDWDSADPVRREFVRRNPSYSPSFDSKEILYARPLRADDSKIRRDPRVRFVNGADFDQWSAFSAAYMLELGLPDQLSEEENRRYYESAIQNKIYWGMFDGPKLVSRAALNSSGPKTGQVGAVFTPSVHRRMGFAKVIMAHMLADCRDLRGHDQSILFTGETDVAAQKLYESIGYVRRGSFALVFAK